MRITLTSVNDEIYSLDVSEDMELENFMALAAFETTVPGEQLQLKHNGRVLSGREKKLKEFGLKDGDVVLFGQRGGSSNVLDFSNIQVPVNRPTQPQASGGQENPAVLMEMLRNSPHELALLKERNPPLASALESGDVNKFTQVLMQQKADKLKREQERLQLLMRDPMDPEVQKHIAEEIRLKNVESNMETAMEYSPESFGQVVMLYINCKVNGHVVKAFVDSGAQMTIMSKACAERCNIMRLVDTRWSGIAKGVGTQQIIGRVHLGQIQIEKDFLQSSFSILEQPMDMLLGLDMLKRHQCVIDLKLNELVIGTTGTKTKFLAEAELPDNARLSMQAPDDGTVTMEEDRQLAEALAKSAEQVTRTQVPSATATGPQRTFPESDINKITNYGFSRDQVIEELTRNHGNVDQAIATLFARSLAGPK
ncbi:DgyrCDS10926 [Dimorphilus gyrociliatus]|uniref:DgyrCDS10926 n=1 Tax=Dimorphilus gyrociliatus TaxID=2664684 RepID=A0A7I8W2X0_9ANNE|nr:DgyrCDS10926 [Dimorphilus gyrociliatus]